MNQIREAWRDGCKLVHPAIDGAWLNDRPAEVFLGRSGLATLQIGHTEVEIDLSAVRICGIAKYSHEVHLRQSVLFHGEVGGPAVVAGVGEAGNEQTSA